MPIYVLFALAAALCFSLNAITSKLVSKHMIKSTLAFVVLSHFLNLPYLPVLAGISKIRFPFAGLMPLFLFSATFFIGGLFIVAVLYRYDISILHPFFHFQTIFSVGLAYLVLGERYPLSIYFWIILIIIGGVLVGTNDNLKPNILFSKNFLLFITGIFFLACSDIFVKQTLAYMDVYNLKFWSSIILIILAAFLLPFVKENLFIGRDKFTALFIAGFFGFLGTIFLFSAFSYNITITQPLAMFGSLLTLLISIAVSQVKPEFLEHYSAKVYMIRLIGVVLMLISAIMVSRA